MVEETKNFQIKTSDGKIFSVDEDLIKISKTLSSLIEDLDDIAEPIPLDSISGETFEMIIEFLKHHKDDYRVFDEQEWFKENEELPEWDQEFLPGETNLKSMFSLITATNYLDIKSLLNMSCAYIANIIKSKEPEDIKKIFGIEGEFSKEEIDAVQKEHPWLLDDPSE